MSDSKDDFFDSVASIELKPSDVIVCPYCQRETKRVLEYTSEEKKYERDANYSDGKCIVDDTIVVEHYTCLECGKGFEYKK